MTTRGDMRLILDVADSPQPEIFDGQRWLSISREEAASIAPAHVSLNARMAVIEAASKRISETK